MELCLFQRYLSHVQFFSIDAEYNPVKSFPFSSSSSFSFPLSSAPPPSQLSFCYIRSTFKPAARTSGRNLSNLAFDLCSHLHAIITTRDKTRGRTILSLLPWMMCIYIYIYVSPIVRGIIFNCVQILAYISIDYRVSFESKTKGLSLFWRSLVQKNQN